MTDGQRVAIVAGASGGIGRATAAGLAADGFRVVVAARSAERLATLAEEIGAAGGEAVAVPADAAIRADCTRVVAAALDRFGRVDALVNTVGVNIPGRQVMEITDETWRLMIDGNLTAAFNLTQAIVPHYRERPGGLLIHISSISALRTDPSGAAYQAAKAGVAALAHATMLEERAHGTRVTVLYPGLIDTDFMKYRPTPVPRAMLDVALQADDVAAACRFVAGLPPHVHIPDMTIMPTALT